MSTLYPDLPLTNFPNNIDQFTTWLNIVSSDGPLISQYQAALQEGNYTLANQILNQIPQSSQKILKATDLNSLTQSLLAVERFYKTDVEPYIDDKQTEWLNIINNFSYKGTWSLGTSYQVNNLVSYTTSGLNLLYLATSTPPVGTPPTNLTYWRIVTIQGQQGESGEGLSYRQEWNTSTNYETNDAVTYSGSLWMALQNNVSITPGTNSNVWKMIISLAAASYPIQPTEPQGLTQGDLWFNTQDNPTDYYYLSPLENDATAENVMLGYECYNETGTLIVGTNDINGYKEEAEQYKANAEQYKAEVEAGQELIATAITNQGIPTSSNDSFETMAQNISLIERGQSFSGNGQCSYISDMRSTPFIINYSEIGLEFIPDVLFLEITPSGSASSGNILNIIVNHNDNFYYSYNEDFYSNNLTVTKTDSQISFQIVANYAGRTLPTGTFSINAYKIS